MVIIDVTVQKHPIPESWPYEAARSLFVKPEVADPDTIDVSIILQLTQYQTVQKIIVLVSDIMDWKNKVPNRTSN